MVRTGEAGRQRDGMVNRIELDITLACNLNCNNCDRACGIAPDKSQVSLDKVKEFVEEANELGIVWRKLAVLGGEPTLHPQMLEILDYLYNNARYEYNVMLKTNGFGKKTNKVLQDVPSYIRIVNTSKSSKNQHFSTYNVAPIDQPMYKEADFSKGCSIADGCGICLNPYGYYACGAGAAVDRVFGLGLSVQSLKELTDEKILEHKRILCQYCGHFKDWGQSHKYVNQQITSKSWRDALCKYNTTKSKDT